MFVDDWMKTRLTLIELLSWLDFIKNRIVIVWNFCLVLVLFCNLNEEENLISDSEKTQISQSFIEFNLDFGNHRQFITSHSAPFHVDMYSVSYHISRLKVYVFTECFFSPLLNENWNLMRLCKKIKSRDVDFLCVSDNNNNLCISDEYLRMYHVQKISMLPRIAWICSTASSQTKAHMSK